MAAIAVNMLLVIALAHTLAGLTLAIATGQLSSLTHTTTSPAARPAIGEDAASQPPADIAAIGAWHLFGKTQVNRPVAAPPPAAAPVTPLNLRLVGVFFAEGSIGSALALIADGDNLERSYQVGDRLPGDARLERIERDQVVVSRKGREELIKLPKLDDPNHPMITPEPTPALPAPVAEPGPTTFSAPQMIEASAIAKQWRGEVLNRPQTLEKIAFAGSYVQNDQFAGLRLQPGRDQRIFQQLGMSSGDILAEANRTRLSSPAQDLALLQELVSAHQIDVQVLHNSAEI